MHSFIIIAKSKDQRHDYITNFCMEKGIGKFDQKIFIPLDDLSFGISDVRNIQKTAYLKPGQSKEKAIILENAHTLTPDAQNALLKLLEEPPPNTYIFLSATTDRFFLPTILSRCKEILLPDELSGMSKENENETYSQLEIVHHGSVGTKLALAEKLAENKENLNEWFVDMVTLLRKRMLSSPTDAAYPTLITCLQEGYQLFQTTNVAPRMILEHIFLSL